MEFKDYYKILEINQTATQEEIRDAFKKQAVKWHPDKNLGKDTTEKMQEINEAYLILKDQEARNRYDQEYLRYKKFTQQSKYKGNKTQNNKKRKEKAEEPNYEFNDEILKKWMRNARRQAVDLAKQTILEVRELSVTATKVAVIKMLEMFVWYFIFGIILLIILKTCSN